MVGYAITYLRCRCVASPAILAIFVAIGSFRGFRDTMWVLACSELPANVTKHRVTSIWRLALTDLHDV